MTQFIIEINDAEEKALLTTMNSVQEFIDNLIHNEAKHHIDRIVEQVTDRQAKKISTEEKLQIVRDAEVESVADRNKIE